MYHMSFLTLRARKHQQEVPFGEPASIIIVPPLQGNNRCYDNSLLAMNHSIAFQEQCLLDDSEEKV